MLTYFEYFFWFSCGKRGSCFALVRIYFVFLRKIDSDSVLAFSLFILFALFCCTDWVSASALYIRAIVKVT